jgi:hypothetical protein
MIGFLIISPNFRETMVDGLHLGVEAMNRYGPWSYLATVALTVVLLMVFLHRAAQPR